MPSEQRELLLEESQGTNCSKGRSLSCTLVWILVCLMIIALAVGLVIFMLEKTVHPPIVHVECGPVEGIFDFEHDVTIYKGIPYAAPPIGKLRWRRPVPLSFGTCWSGTLKATSATTCPQMDVSTNEYIGKEDCLTLDVWVPGLHKKPLPVAVYIHGGGLVFGNSSMPGYSPDAELTDDMQTVFVSINYRLGPLGFLVAKELGDNQTGNYGVWDQIEALKWVKVNIANFGGDPDQVTVIGHSAAASSVMALLVSPHAKGLYNRAWIMSGAPRLTATIKDALNSPSPIVNGTGCKDATCLRDLPARMFFKNNTDILEMDLLPKKGAIPAPPLIFIDGDLIPGTRDEIWNSKTGKYSDVPILLGTTAQETDDTWPKNKLNFTNECMIKAINDSLNDFGSNLTEEALAIYNFSASRDPVYKITTLSTDIYMTCGNNRIARDASSALSSPVYRYIVTSCPSSPVNVFYGSFVANYAFHCWDAYSFFNGQNMYLERPPQKSDIDFKQTLRSLAKDFIMHGSISGWQNYPKSTPLIDRNVTFIKNAYHMQQCEFWKTNGLLAYELAV